MIRSIVGFLTMMHTKASRLGITFLIVLLFGGSYATFACKPRRINDANVSSLGKVAANSTALARRMLRRTLVIDPVFKAAQRSPEYARSITNTFEDASLAFNSTIQRNHKSMRKTLVSLLRNRETRTSVRRSAVSFLRNRSRISKQLIQSGKANQTDVLVIGAGPHGAGFVDRLTEVIDGKSRVMVVDAASEPGGAFAQAGDTFRLNTPPEMNTISDLFGQTDYVTTRYPLASDMAGDTGLALAISDSDTVLGLKIVDNGIRDLGLGNAQGRYAVTMADTNGKAYTVFTNKVVFATGLGEASLGKVSDPDSIALFHRFQQVRNELDAVTGMPRKPKIETASQAHADFAASRDPLAFYRTVLQNEGDILILGQANSAMTVTEVLTQVADELAMGQSAGQKPLSAIAKETGNKIKIVGSSREKFTALLIDQPRYARLMDAIVDGTVEFVPGRISKITESAGGRFATIMDNGTRVEGAHGVNALGFSDETGKVLGDLVRAEPSTFELAEHTVGRRMNIDGEEVPVYSQLKEQDIFFAGPANPEIKNRVVLDPQTGRPVNPIAVGRTMKNTKAAAELIGVDIRPMGLRTVDDILSGSPRPTINANSTPVDAPAVKLKVPQTPFRQGELENLEQELITHVYQWLNRFEFNVERLDLRVAGQGDELLVRIAGVAEHNDMIRVLGEDVEFLNVLTKYFQGGSKVKELVVFMPLTSRGELLPSAITVKTLNRSTLNRPGSGRLNDALDQRFNP